MDKFIDLFEVNLKFFIGFLNLNQYVLLAGHRIE